MALTFANEVNLTEYPYNPYPSVVKQLHMVHEAKDGELVQYYINAATQTEGDKNTFAIGVAVLNAYGEVNYYEYTEYPDVHFSRQKSRITRQKIDRIGLKAFPNVGSIAFYKLAYRNVSQIVAPVNYSVAKQKYPTLSANVAADKRSVTFKFADPIDPQTGEVSITYNAYRVCLVLDYHQIDVITYNKEVTVSNIPVSGEYLCYVIGYINEGEICSTLSNTLMLDLAGMFSKWPDVTEGKVLTYTICRLGNDINLRGIDASVSSATLSPAEVLVDIPISAWIENKATIASEKILTDSVLSILPVLAVDDAAIQNNIAVREANIMEISHTDGFVDLYCVNVPTVDLQVRLLIQ